MPLYEYRCENCGDVFEVIQKFSDEPLGSHDKCGGKVVRLVSAPALQFKGSGWYVNDYAKGSNPAPSSGNKKNDSDGSSSSSGDKPSTPAATTSESKPSKSESKPGKSSDTK